jgi:hypothetical protein
MKGKDTDFFWPSFTDLMTSLFFIMLVLYVLTYLKLTNEREIIENQKKVTEQQLNKIKEIQKALGALPSEYFIYNDEFKKHILNVSVNFKRGSANMLDLKLETRLKIRIAGKVLERILRDSLPTDQNIKYLLVIEGQASKDNAPINDELSYSRAISLRNFWFGSKPNMNKVLPNCEVIIAGSGQYGVPRDTPDIPPKNQRFMITVIPKIGNIRD